MTTEIEVMERAVERRSVSLFTPRRLVLAFVVLAAVLMPVAALGAAKDWWFLRYGGTPVPTTAPQVVKEGEWNGHRWQLIAYPSATHGLCISFTPKDSGDNGGGGALGCGSFVGVARTPEAKASPDMTITFMAADATEQLPARIVGAVIDEASVVEIHFVDGDVLRVPTFAGPEPMQHVRFYAARLPANFRLTPENFTRVFPSWVAGLDASGSVVACSAPRTAKDGISSLSDCR
ncbi:MAG: hypothetical protein WKF65_04220 [Gaiellaceae bacterium]